MSTRTILDYSLSYTQKMPKLKNEHLVTRIHRNHLIIQKCEYFRDSFRKPQFVVNHRHSLFKLKKFDQTFLIFGMKHTEK